MLPYIARHQWSLAGRGLVRWAVAGAMLAGLAAARPAQALPFEQWLDGVRAEASRAGIGAKTLDAALADISLIPRVIELDRAQPEFTLTFDQYMARVVSPRRVRKGRAKFAENRALLQEVGQKYKVQPRFIVALWGIETDFGRISGGFPVIPALATLAYDGRRSSYFRKELIAALTILDEGHIAPDKMIGSWAGAMGQSQFMPSSFLRFAVDHNGDGRKDIWTTRADVFASAANYLARSGWRGDQTWGREVGLTKAVDPAQFGLKVVKPMRAWQELGVRRADGSDLPRRQLAASLIQPGGAKAKTFLVYNNFRTVMKWNRSTYFATAVGRLADRVAGH